MSEVIVWMEMPTGCPHCPMADDDSRFCKAAKKYIPMLGKPSWCPIKGELVRCKECRWACLAPQRQTATCMKKRLPFTHDYDFFCADGERKDGEHEL